MKGLLLKELYGFYAIGKSLLLIPAVILGLFLLNGEGATLYALFSILPPVVSRISIILATSSINMDSASKWNSYAVTLPVSRRQIIQAKYLICIGAGCLIQILVLILRLAFSGGEGWTGILVESLVTMGVQVVPVSILFPLMIRFGPEKSRLILALIFGLVGASIPLIGFNEGFSGLEPGSWPLSSPAALIGGAAAVLAFLAVLLGLSYSLSVRFFCRQEL